MKVKPEAGGNRFDVMVRQRGQEDRRIENVFLPMPGRHNVQNALAAIAVSLEMNCSDEVIREGFARFGGVRRRFTRVGTVPVAGGSATVIDDYAHHPVEIRAVLSAARESVDAMDTPARVIAVMQPHRFSRLGELMGDFQACFNEADQVYVAPVYAAGEDPVEGVDAAALVDGIKSLGHRHAQTIADREELVRALAPQLEPGDLVLCLGAGDITKWAAKLPGELQAACEQVNA